MEGKVETMAIEEKASDSEYSISGSELDDLMAELLTDDPAEPEEGEVLPLKQMYNETFGVATVQKEDLQDLTFNAEILLQNFKKVYKKVYKEAPAEEKKTVKSFINRMITFLQNNNTRKVSETIKDMIQKDYMNSELNASAYKKRFESLDYEAKAQKLLASLFSEKVTKKMVVDPEKKNKLLRIIHMAIKIGLNYQMLEPFKSKFLPPTEEITAEEYDELFKDEIVTDEMLAKYGDPIKKVSVEDLSSHPYWENIRVFPDLTDFVTLHALKTLKTDQLINTVKRTTLYHVYKVKHDYRLNLDEASASDLQQLCGLTTLRLAPRVHYAATRYFLGGDNENRMRTMYDKWLNSSKSFKMYTKPVEVKFFNIPKFPFKPETTVNDVLEDVSKLPGLFWYTKDEDPDSESIKNGDLERSDVPADANFAIELSRKFVEMGFLPVGYERYCGVKAGEVNPKRSTDGMESPAKRQRRKLFTPIEIH